MNHTLVHNYIARCIEHAERECLVNSMPLLITLNLDPLKSSNDDIKDKEKYIECCAAWRSKEKNVSEIIMHFEKADRERLHVHMLVFLKDPVINTVKTQKFFHKLIGRSHIKHEVCCNIQIVTKTMPNIIRVVKYLNKQNVLLPVIMNCDADILNINE